MCESHVSLLQTVGKCCSSELTAAALPRPGRAAGGTAAGAHRPPRRVFSQRFRAAPLPAPALRVARDSRAPRACSSAGLTGTTVLREGWGLQSYVA